MTYRLLVSRRSVKTGRWLVYRFHSSYDSYYSASLAGLSILDSEPADVVRFKVEPYKS